jgi:hypothetical protein
MPPALWPEHSDKHQQGNPFFLQKMISSRAVPIHPGNFKFSTTNNFEDDRFLLVALWDLMHQIY